MEIFFQATTEQAAALKSASLKNLAKRVRSLKIRKEKEIEETRPLKLLIPKALDDALIRSARLGHKKKHALLLAAREFRKRYPQSKRLLDESPNMDNDPKKTRRSMVVRISEDERELLQNIGRGNSRIGNRHDALITMAAILDELELPKLPAKGRATISLTVPDDLNEAINARHKETGIPKIQILLQAIANNYSV